MVFTPISEKVNFKIKPLYKDLKNINTSTGVGGSGHIEQ